MIYRFGTSALLLCAVVSASAQQASLISLFRNALGTDPAVRSAHSTARAAKYGVSETRASLLPQVDFSYSESQIDETQRVASDGETLEAPRDYRANVQALTIQLPVIAPEQWMAVRSAKTSHSASVQSLRSSQHQLAVRLAEAYFSFLKAQNDIAATQADVRSASERHDQAAQRYRVGLASILEVEEAKFALDLARASHISSTSMLEAARESLAAVVGYDPGQVEDLPSGYLTLPPMPADPEAWVSIGLAQNPALHAGKTQARAAHQSATSRRMRHLPRVDLQFRSQEQTSFSPTIFAGVPSQFAGLPQDDERLSLSLTVPLFSGLGVSAGAKRLRAQADAADADAEALRRRTRQQIRELYFSVRTASALVTAREQAVRSAQAAADATQKGYEVGTRNIVELLDAQRSLVAAKRDFKAAMYDHALGTLRLKAAAGVIQPRDLQLGTTRL